MLLLYPTCLCLHKVIIAEVNWYVWKAKSAYLPIYSKGTCFLVPKLVAEKYSWKLWHQFQGMTVLIPLFKSFLFVLLC